MKAKGLVGLIVFLGALIGCKEKAKTEYDFIAFRDTLGGNQIFPTGTDYRFMDMIGYDLKCDGFAESIYSRATEEGLTENTPGAETVIDIWNKKFQWSQENGRVKYVQQDK